jgi:hypothetical protein
LSIFKSDLVLSQVTLKEQEMLPEKVHFTHEKETMLITLYGRALQINALTGHFPSGRMAFDVHTPQLVRWLTKTGANVRGTGATFSWGIDDPQDIKHLEPRLELITELRAHNLAAYSNMPWNIRALVRLMDAIPTLRIMRCLLYQFERS